MQRDKGKRWEREIAARLREIFGEDVRRGWQARSGGDDPDIVDVPNFWVEAKHHKVVNIGAAIRQVLIAKKKKDDRWPLIVSKSDRQEPLATMTWESFLEMLRQWWEARAATETMTNKLATLSPKRDELMNVVMIAQEVFPILQQNGYGDLPAVQKLAAAIQKCFDSKLTSSVQHHNAPTLQPAIADVR